MAIEPAVSTPKAAKKISRSLRRLTKMSAGISRPRGGRLGPVDLRDPLGREVAGAAVEHEPALVNAENAVGISQRDIDLMQIDDDGDVHLVGEPLQLLHDHLRRVR